MREDPIVNEVRETGQKYVDSFKGDWKALIADLRQRSQQEGRRVVALPPKPPKKHVAASK